MVYTNNIAEGLGHGMEQLIQTVEHFFFPFFSAILGGTSDMLFERILFLAIIFAIVYIVISNIEIFKGNSAIVWIVSICVSLLSTRFLVDEGLIQTMLLPYSALGVALTAVLPILIYFKFVYSFTENSITRKMLWVFYIVAFIMIWGSRYDEVGNLSWMYLASAIAAFLFLLFDGTIMRMSMMQEMKASDITNHQKYLAKLRKDLKEIADNADNYSSPAVFKKVYDKQFKRLKQAEKAKF